MKFLWMRKIIESAISNWFIFISGIYGWIFFPPGWTSVNSTNSWESMRETVGDYNYFALAMFLIMHFCVSVGVSWIPYVMMFELFPFKWVQPNQYKHMQIPVTYLRFTMIFRSRSFYCGITGAENQLFAFIATKTYFDLERIFSLPGVICFYAVLGVLG